MASQITVTDATTNQPIAGASVFIVTSGTGVNTLTDSNGVAGNIVAGTVTDVEVSADGYSPWMDTSLPTSVALAPVAAETNSFTFTVEPVSDQSNPNNGAPTAGASLVLKNAAGAVLETLTVGSDGTCYTADVYPNGPYSISISATGYTPIVNQAVTITSDPTFTLTKNTPPNPTTNPSAVAPTTTPSSTAPAVSQNASQSSAQAPQYEYIYPNSVDGTYFQAAQARMYIGNLFIDELVTCQFQLMQNRIPIYGYRSKKYDAIGNGHSLVQGQIAINFVTEGYLYVVLKEFGRLQSANTPSDTDPPPAIKTQIDQLIQLLGQTTDPTAQASIMQTLATCAAQDPSGNAIAYLKQALGIAPGNNGVNACYLDIPFDIQVQLSGAGRTVTRTISDCVLGANDFAYAHDGRTILDSYSFIGRELV